MQVRDEKTPPASETVAIDRTSATPTPPNEEKKIHIATTTTSSTLPPLPLIQPVVNGASEEDGTSEDIFQQQQQQEEGKSMEKKMKLDQPRLPNIPIPVRVAAIRKSKP